MSEDGSHGFLHVHFSLRTDDGVIIHVVYGGPVDMANGSVGLPRLATIVTSG